MKFTPKRIALLGAAVLAYMLRLVGNPAYRRLLDPRHLRHLSQTRDRHGYTFVAGSVYDAIHSNTIEVIERDVNDIIRRGRILYCSRTLDLIGVIDIDTQELVWSWARGFSSDPTILRC